ncbi:MAG TPA: GDSL-type esterase/lipase family protein [Candidatus Hydrogenedentes bacterium]|nr:GDSL-type esterase/lipase family protein [Candidatus Hydrogenedentota bacterium]
MKRLVARVLFGLFVVTLWSGVLVLGLVAWGRWEFESSLVNNRFIQARYGSADWPLTRETTLDPVTLDVAEREAWIGPGKSTKPIPLSVEQERQRWIERARYFPELPVPLRFTFARMYKVDIYGVNDQGEVVARYPEELPQPAMPMVDVVPGSVVPLLASPAGGTDESAEWIADPAGTGTPPWVIRLRGTFVHQDGEPPGPSDATSLLLFVPRLGEYREHALWDSEYFAMHPYYLENDPPPGPGQPRGAFISINNVGLRDYDVILPKPPGVCRVLCVGASTTYEGMHNLLTYPGFVEYLLNRRAGTRRVDVINGGVSGMNSAKHRVKLADYLFLEPDIVVFYLGVNDVMHVIYPLMKIWLDGPRQLLSLRPVKRMLWRVMLPDESEIDRRVARVQEDLRAVAEKFIARGIRVVFCTFAAPDPARLTGEERAYLEYCIEREWGGDQCSYATYYYLLSRYNLGLRRMARELNAPCIPVAEAIGEGLVLFGDICHMRNPGIERKAKVIAEALEPLIEACPKEQDLSGSETPRTGSQGN